MADKLTHFLLDALTRAAADPAGTPLFAAKGEPGLFPAVAAAKSAAAKAMADGLLRVVRTEARGKQTRELCAATDKGMQFLLEQVSPKQVLEDFVRVLEDRRDDVAALQSAVTRMADSLDGLSATVTALLPKVSSTRIHVEPSDDFEPTVPFTRPHLVPPDGPAMPAVVEAPAAVAEAEELAEVVLARLADWATSAPAGQDCPLPDLFRSLSTREVPPTIGTFHDCLRALHEANRVYLHPWTGPLYALPEPAYALLVGHNVAFYASAR